jgi:hypothetical protein
MAYHLTRENRTVVLPKIKGVMMNMRAAEGGGLSTTVMVVVASDGFTGIQAT